MSHDMRAAKTLVAATSFAVHPRGPFNARTTIHKPSHFPSPFDLVDGHSYVFVTRIRNEVVGARATYGSDGRALTVAVYVSEGVGRSGVMAPDVRGELSRRLGLQLDTSGFGGIWKGDSILSRLAPEMLGARPSSPFSLYEFLVICTLLQNTTVRRTVQMANALATVLGQPCVFPDGTVLTGFWTPDALVRLGEPALRELKLGYRAKSLYRLSAQFAESPTLESDLLAAAHEPDSLRSSLRSLYGVGPASCGYVMFEWFKCLDEFTHVSPWERKILSMLLFDAPDAEAPKLLAFCQDRWRPWTMLAVHAVFESVFWRRLCGSGPSWLDDLIRL